MPSLPVYSTSEGDIVLTGVGLYSDPQSGEFFAPPDPGSRWDDPGYQSPPEDEFAVMTQAEINGRRGFVFHDACWSLLKQAFHPGTVPYPRLFDVLDSLPKVTVGNTIDWGHDYGGLAILADDGQYFPWEPFRFSDRRFRDGWLDTPYSFNPFAVSEVEEILSETAQPPPSWDPSSSSTARSIRSISNRDPFDLLPTELCSAIAAQLPTQAVLNARCASRSFWHVFNSQQFWASRFKGKTSERSWLFEAVQKAESNSGARHRDWRWLYHRTIDAHLSLAARNRKRVWGLILHVADILDLCWNELPSVLASPWRPPPLLEENSLGPSWILVAGGVRGWPEDLNPLQTGCSRSKVQRVAIPTHGVSKLAASTVRLGSSVFISGLSLTTTKGEVMRLGYRGAGGERSVQLHGSTLTGFNLAVGLGGIHGLQCIGDSSSGGQMSAWLGSPDGAPKTKRLSTVANGPVVVVEFGFDVRQAGFFFALTVLTFSRAHQLWFGLRASEWLVSPLFSHGRRRRHRGRAVTTATASDIWQYGIPTSRVQPWI